MSQDILSSGPNDFTLDDDMNSYDDTISKTRQEDSESTISSTHMPSFLNNDDEQDDDMSSHDETNFQKISGTVRCSKDGMGVKGIDVHLVDAGQAGNSTVTVKTDVEGNFTFFSVQSGTYIISLKETDVQPNTSNIIRKMSSKVVTVQDGIDIDRVILVRNGPSIVNKNDPSSQYKADNNNEWRSRSKTTQVENIAELNKKDLSLPEPISRIHKGNNTMCMRGLSIGTEDSWDHLKYDDDISLNDEAMDVIVEKYSAEASVHHNHDQDGEGEGPNVCMRGLSLDPETSAWEIGDTSGCPNDDENDDDMSFQNETNLQKVSGIVCCSMDETGFREASVQLVSTGHAGISTAIVKTDTNGNFTFSNVQSGTYTIRVQPLPSVSNESRPIPPPKVVTVEDGIDIDRVIVRYEPSHDSSLLSDDISAGDSNNSSQGYVSHDEDKAGDEDKKRKETSLYSLHFCTVMISSVAFIVLLKSRKR